MALQIASESVDEMKGNLASPGCLSTSKPA